MGVSAQAGPPRSETDRASVLLAIVIITVVTPNARKKGFYLSAQLPQFISSKDTPLIPSILQIPFLLFHHGPEGTLPS